MLAHIPNEAQTQMLKRMERYYSAVQNMIDHKISEDNNIPENTGIIMRSNRDFFILQIKGQKLVCQTIQFEHNKNNILFELSEESDGTVRILDLLEILLSDEGKTYVVDELDRCLHPSLTYKFIETYLKLAAKKNLQLIVTTHESRLLDFDLLRRDEIWFIDKQNTGESDIYSLEEYNTRFDQKIVKLIWKDVMEEYRYLTRYTEHELRKLLPGLRKSKYNTEVLMEHIDRAIINENEIL